MLKQLTVITVVLLFLCQIAEAQYTMTLQNDALVDNGGAYEFDVVIASTSGTITLTSYQLIFTYNTAIARAAPLSFSYVGGSSGLTNLPNLGVGIIVDGVSNLVAASSAGSDNVTTTPVKVGRFRISSTQGFAIVSPNVAWDFGGGLFTVVNINNSNATNPSNHVNSLANPALPIQLFSFTAIAVGESSVQLHWKTLSEIDNLGFEVQCSMQSAGPFESIAGSFIAGHGTTIDPQEYSYTVATTEGKNWYYRLKQMDRSGSVNYTDAVQATVTSVGKEAAVPTAYALEQNYPNPFNPSTIIQYALPQRGHVTLMVYNTLGQQVAQLVNGDIDVGYHELRFNASGLGSGVYLYRLQAGNFVETKKFLLLR